VRLLSRCVRLTAVSILAAVYFPAPALAQFTGFVRPVDWGPYDGAIPPSPTCRNGTSASHVVYYSTTYLGNYCPPDGLGNGSEGTGSHVGVDILFDKNGSRLTSSTEVRAIYDGRITRRTEVGDTSGWGNALVIRHTGIPEAGVIYSTYAHLSRIATNHNGIEWRKDHDVKKGDLLGWVGATDVDGLHLHFQLDPDYLDKEPCGRGTAHPFYPDRVASAEKEENEPDTDNCVARHTLHPIAFVESHLEASPPEQPVYVSLANGDPAVPGDGVLMSVPAIGWKVADPISLASFANGLTITLFSPGVDLSGLPPTTNQLGVDIENPGAAIGCALTLFGVSLDAPHGPVLVNGVTGMYTNISQYDLAGFVTTANFLKPACNIQLSDLVITGLTAIHSFVSPNYLFVTSVDALAIGKGIDNYPEGGSGTPPPASIVTLRISTGSSQTGSAGAILPNAVSVMSVDQAGNPVGLVSLTFRVTSGGGCVSVSPSGTTCQSELAMNTNGTSGSFPGLAGVFWTLGPLLGTQTVEVASPGLSTITFSAYATP
jgi:hypothetical protein